MTPWDDEPFYYPRVTGEIFHVTSQKGFDSICRDGFIKANRGERPYTFPQSRKSYAMKMGSVSLFDFYNCGEKHIQQMHHVWGSVVAKHNPGLILLFHCGKISTSLITNQMANLDIRGESMRVNYHIPLVEAWFPRKIKISYCKAILKIDFKKDYISDIPINLTEIE